LRLKVEEIKQKPVRIRVEEAADDYPALAELSSTGECDFTTPLIVDLTALQEYDHIRVDGTIETSVRLHCSRCLEEFEKYVATSFTLFYNKTTGAPIDDETELREEDLHTVFYEGDYIDFTGEIEEQLIMEIPYKPLCKDECKGLCGVCGANLNDGECGCGAEPSSFKFGALKDFKVNK
jgi:uncharacterized protein